MTDFTKLAKEQLGEDLESWKSAHIEAMACCDFEDLLRKHLRGLQWIRLVDDGWSRRVESGEAPFDPDRAKLIREMYEVWYEPCDRMLAHLGRWEKDYPDLRGGSEFRAARHLVRSILRAPLEMLV